MLNGKFYTGLPPKMIERSGGRDHQKTNFFWPDETNSKSVSDKKNRNTARNNTTATLMQYEPQELFKKELTSKIKFYDLIDDDFKTNTNHFQNNANVKNMKNNDKFYAKTKPADPTEINDFSEKYNKPERNIKKEVGRNKPELQKFINKRITFNENDKKISPQNNEMMKALSASKQRGLINKNKSLSKSFDNLPVKLINNNDDQDDYINLIENDVNNIKVPFGKDYYYESEYNFDEIPHPQKNEASKYTKDDKIITIQDIRRPRYPQKHNYEPNQENENRFFKSQQRNKSSYEKNDYDQNINDYYNHSNSSEKNNYDNNSNTRHIEIRLSPSRELPCKEKNSLNECGKRNHNNIPHKNNEMISSPTHINEPLYLNKNRHLRSNIIFSDQIPNQHSVAPERKTIRSSAVSRVSVGLPEF